MVTIMLTFKEEIIYLCLLKMIEKDSTVQLIV